MNASLGRVAESARGLAHSKTLRAVPCLIEIRASVLECGSPLPLWEELNRD